MDNTNKHWDDIYSKSETKKLGWFEDIPEPSLELIQRCNLDKSATIIDVGSGVTTLIKNLIEDNYQNVTALDISKSAIEKAQKNMEPEFANQVNWIVDDITNPRNITSETKFDLWHDRTVLHFLTDEKEQNGYLSTLKKVVKKGGYVIIAVFAPGGAKKCSGLDVKNYDQKMISEFLGNEFKLLEYLLYTYIQPSGSERLYVYTLFKRIR